MDVEPAPSDAVEPVAIVRDWDGEWRELPVAQLRLEQYIDDDLLATPPTGGGVD
jgi:hypothetical protein